VQNPDIARLFEEVADLLEIQGANPFRVRAYRNAARTILDLPDPLAEGVREASDLTTIPGIGEDLAAKIATIVRTGGLPLHRQLVKQLSPGVLDLLRIPGLGPKRVKLLRSKLKVKSAADLAKALDAGRFDDATASYHQAREEFARAAAEAEAARARAREAARQRATRARSQAEAADAAALAAGAAEYARSALAEANAQLTEARLSAERDPIAAAFRLPVLDLALPALKEGDAQARKQLITALEAVIHADRRVTLHELVVLTLMRHQLENAAAPIKIRTRALKDLRAEVTALLWLLCLAGRPSGPDAEDKLEGAFRAGLSEMTLEASPSPRDSTPSLEAVQQGLDRLRALAPLAKARLVQGLFAAASYDGTLRVAEVELLRLTGAVLDCPLPPLVTEIDLATVEA